MLQYCNLMFRPGPCGEDDDHPATPAHSGSAAHCPASRKSARHRAVGNGRRTVANRHTPRQGEFDSASRLEFIRVDPLTKNTAFERRGDRPLGRKYSIGSS